MALVGFWGFDDGAGEQGVTGASNTAGRTGGLCATAPIITPGGTYAEVFFGTAWLSIATFGTGAMVSLREGTIVHVAVRTETDGRLSLLRGATVVATTAAAVVTPSSWEYLEVHALIADTGGTAEVRVNGVSVLTYSGDTRNAGTTGLIDNVSLTWSSTNQERWDDAYLCSPAGAAPYNTYLGDVVVRTPLPSGNGDSSGFLGSDGNSIDNYALVDETNSSATDYVGSATSGATDLYAMDDIPTGYDVLAVQELVYNAKSDGGTPPVLIPCAKGALGTVRSEAALSLSVTYLSTPCAIQTTDPDGNPLTAARVNAMQVGMRIP